jgi:hypothetical protein
MKTGYSDRPKSFKHFEMKKGFYISCKKGREEKAFKEVSGVLKNLLESSKEYSQYEDIDIEKEIKKEVDLLHSNPFKIYFQYCSMLFISNGSSISSSHLYNLLRENQVSFVFAHRVVPFDAFFKFEETLLCEMIKCIKTDKTYKILYEERFVPENMKLRVFDCITSNLKCTVDLSNPYYLIVVQALKNFIGVSVIENEKFNFNFSKDSKKTYEKEV